MRKSISVRPVDIIEACIQALYIQSQTLGDYGDERYVPNKYLIILSPQAYQQLGRVHRYRLKKKIPTYLERELKTLNQSKDHFRQRFKSITNWVWGLLMGYPAQPNVWARSGRNWVIEFEEELDTSENPLIRVEVAFEPEQDFGSPNDPLATIRPSSAKPSSYKTHRAPLATVAYRDERGRPWTYNMQKNLIKIGRGDEEQPVDLTIPIDTDVSREHCHIRRNIEGQFELKDVSRYGTQINGEGVAPSIIEGVDLHIWHSLPKYAQITLAERVHLNFQAN